jgi:hypothetical protein
MQPTDQQLVEKKIELLTNRVDDVYQILDQLHQHLLPENQVSRDRRESAAPKAVKKIQPQQNFPKIDIQESADWLIHQDVLIDNETSSYRQQETMLSPQSQIQRLTAQLTVAYSRIAALEEQLLARQRVHS